MNTPTEVPTGRELYKSLLARVLKCAVAGLIADELEKADLMGAIGRVSMTQSSVAFFLSVCIKFIIFIYLR
jgi:hypothetical protein